jgi:hypothetical protein
MATETLNPPDTQSMTGLISGIAADAQELVKQQVALARAEIKSDFRQTIQATAFIAGGGVFAVPALMMVCHMAASMLHEMNGFSMSASHAIVAGVVGALAIILIGVGIQRFRAIHGFLSNSVQALKEDVQWIKNPK